MLPRHRFYFLRHGQTDWNAQSRIQGHTDTELNKIGLAQARVAGERLAEASITRIVSSPLQRARKTAAIVAERLGLSVEVDEGLKERAFGSFEGGNVVEIKRRHGIPPEQMLSTILPPDAEQWPQTCERARAVVAKWLTDHPAETLLFVSHDGIFRALHEQLVGTRPGATHATPYLFVPKANAWTVTEIGTA